MARAVRQSSYRHVFGTEAKTPEQFLGLKPMFPPDATNNIAASPNHFALPWTGGGGPVFVSDMKSHGRLGSTVPLIQTPKQTVIHLQFHPFVDKILATGADDAYIHLNELPEGPLKEHITKPAGVLQGHAKKITYFQFHPTANNVLASISADNTVKTWEVQAQSETTSFEMPEQPFHFDWNTDGSLAVVACKDKHFYLLDPRQKSAAQKHGSFSINKKYTMLFADNQGALVGVGGNSSSLRQLACWDIKNLSKPAQVVDLDSSSGAIIAQYDPDNSILWLAGKGDQSVKYYELVKETFTLAPLAEYRQGESQKGGCFMPKRTVDVKKCEIANFLRLTADAVIPISFQVPRKSDLFQKDIFPDAYAGVSSQSAGEWLQGKNAAPVLQSMEPGKAAKKEGGSYSASEKPSIPQLEARVAALEAEVARLKIKAGE